MPLGNFELHWLDRSEAAINKGYEFISLVAFSDDTDKEKP